MSTDDRLPSESASYENVLVDSDGSVAQLGQVAPSFGARIQYFLHRNPTTIPVFVLLAGIVAFGTIAGGRLLTCR